MIEPDLDEIEMTVDAHGMDPVKVLALARTLGAQSLPRTLVVGCEPQTRMSAEDERDRRRADRARARARSIAPWSSSRASSQI